MLFHYLSQVQHTNAVAVSVANINIMGMPWRIEKNGVDCGVFAMRHMETFCGEDVYIWKSSFDIEGDVQKYQINNLRHKYVAKILLSNMNLNKQYMLDEAELYGKLSDMEKTLLRDGAEERIEARLEGSA